MPLETCSQCGGSGWVKASQETAAVRRCDCVSRGRAERLLANAHVPMRYKHCDFEGFKTPNDSIQNALLKAKGFVSRYPVEKEGLLLTGTIGVGKTHLAVAIIRELIQSKGVPCLFCDYRELLKEIQNSYNPSVGTTEMQVLRPVLETEVVVLDELGVIKASTNWVQDTVSVILNARYNNMLTTIITTNLLDQPPGAVGREETLGDRIGERMRSRLHEMCSKVEVTGKDLRQSVKAISSR